MAIKRRIIIDHDRGLMYVHTTAKQSPIYWSVLCSPCCFGAEIKFLRDEMGMYPARVFQCQACGKEFKS